MKIIRDKHRKILVNKAAEIIWARLKKLEKQSCITLGLVGGRSVEEIYAALSKKDMPAWKKTHFFLVDERDVPKTDKESNYRLIKECMFNELLKRKQITLKNIHPMHTELASGKAVQDYKKVLDKYGGIFDIAIVSSGEDGHIGAIFPGRTYPEDASFAYLTDSPKPPSKRFTSTPGLISKTKYCLVVYFGKEKKVALENFLNDSFRKTLPQKTLKEIKELIILTDQ